MDSLLPRPNVHAILSFAADHVQWQHCCVFFPTFWLEVEAFWKSMESGWGRVDPTWIALFYVLQGIAVHQMTDEDALQCGLAEGGSEYGRSRLMSSRSLHPPERPDFRCRGRTLSWTVSQLSYHLDRPSHRHPHRLWTQCVRIRLPFHPTRHRYQERTSVESTRVRQGFGTSQVESGTIRVVKSAKCHRC